MKLQPEALAGQIAKRLAAVYLIAGDEPLLVQEVADQLRAAVRAQGFSERRVWHVASGFSWNDWLNESLTGSLFATRQLTELRFTQSKIAEEGVKALTDYLTQPSPDQVVLLVMGKLEGDAQRSAWMKLIDDAGVVVQVWPLTRATLPSWITRRMRERGLQPTPGAVELLVERTEGNALACAQEIDKLGLLIGKGAVDEETLAQAVADSARFDIYGMVDASLAGDGRRVTRMVDRLREEGVEPVLVLWALAREIRSLAVMGHARTKGASIDQVLLAQRVWEKRKPLVKKALQRMAAGDVEGWLSRAHHADLAIKGAAPGNAWDELLNLALQVAGVKLFNAA